MAHLKISENAACIPAVARAVGKGCAMARFFGTSSPNTIENEVARIRAITKDVAAAADSLKPIADSTGVMKRARTGSDR